MTNPQRLPADPGGYQSVTLRLPLEIVAALRQLAEAEGVTVNRAAAEALGRGLQAAE